MSAAMLFAMSGLVVFAFATDASDFTKGSMVGMLAVCLMLNVAFYAFTKGK